MLQKYYEMVMKKAEQLLDRKCETCQDYVICWGSEKLKENACDHWTPDYKLLETKMIIIENQIKKEIAKRKSSTTEGQNEQKQPVIGADHTG